MNRIARTLAIASLAASSAFFLPAAHADALNPDAFVKMCDADKDGMVSKAEVSRQITGATQAWQRKTQADRTGTRSLRA